jgi:1-acyl-sn-glycerol-3-phosphate acyltransferase
LAALLVGLYTTALGIPTLVLAVLDRRGRWAHACARLWGRLIARSFGIVVRVEGAANIPSGPAVFAANHVSAADIPIVFGFLPFEFRIIHKRSLSLVPVVGWCLALGGHIAIDRSNAFKARHSLATAIERVRNGASVVVFPEGTRSTDGNVGLFKRGSFALAQNAGVPVVPVSIVGVRRVMPSGLGSLRRGEVVLRLHPPIPTSGRSPDAAEALADETRGAVLRGCQEALE